MNCIFWGHVATVIQKKYMFNMYRAEEESVGGKRICEDKFSYYVPMTLLVLAPVSFPLKLLAMPKSDILGSISVSSKILLAFKSLWIILNLES